MRIISQGGNADLPYEEIALCMACEDIIARHNDKEYLMARYSTMDKAKKAMEMLRTAYTGTPLIFENCDVTDEVFEELKRRSIEAILTVTNDKPKVDYLDNFYFQFPKDEDVSVSETKKSKSFGEKVLNILKHKGISQRELAEKVGCTEVSMSRYISGDRVPKGPVIAKMANVLGVTTDYLIFESELSE